MTKQNKKSIIIFDEEPVRRVWSEKDEKWYFSVVDVVKVLTQSPGPRKYWSALKMKLSNEGSEVSQKLGQLKMESSEFLKFFRIVLVNRYKM